MWGGGGPMGKCMGAPMATCTWGALPGARPGVEAAGWGPVLVVLCEVVVCPVVAPGPCWAATAAWWAARWPDWAAFTAARCAASSEGSGTGGGATAADWGPEGGAPTAHPELRRVLDTWAARGDLARLVPVLLAAKGRPGAPTGKVLRALLHSCLLAWPAAVVTDMEELWGALQGRLDLLDWLRQPLQAGRLHTAVAADARRVERLRLAARAPWLLTPCNPTHPGCNAVHPGCSLYVPRLQPCVPRLQPLCISGALRLLLGPIHLGPPAARVRLPARLEAARHRAHAARGQGGMGAGQAHRPAAPPPRRYAGTRLSRHAAPMLPATRPHHQL